MEINIRSLKKWREEEEEEVAPLVNYCLTHCQISASWCL